MQPAGNGESDARLRDVRDAVEKDVRRAPPSLKTREEQVRAAESAISLALVGNLTPYDPIYQQRMAGFTAALTPLIGAPPQAARQAHGLMYLLVQQQASYQAFMAVFGWSAVLTATAVLARY